MTSIKLVKKCLNEFKLMLLLILTLTVLWKFGFLNNVGRNWKQFTFEELGENKEEEWAWWKKSPLWVEDQKPHINPHKYR